MNATTPRKETSGRSQVSLPSAEGGPPQGAGPGGAVVLVTRPAEQAAGWVARLRAAGLEAEALPLIAIHAADDTHAVDRAWQDLALRDMLVFVSPNAVQQFFARKPAGMVWPSHTLAATVGPGSSRELRDAGVPAAQVLEPDAESASFDSESLWLQLAARDWQGKNVLLVRGDGGREWLGERLREHGARVDAVQAYRRGAPVLDAAQQDLLAAARATPRDFVWLLSSSEAIDNLSSLVPADADWSQAQAIATHERIAERARAQGFDRVALARPKLQAVVAAVRGLR